MTVHHGVLLFDLAEPAIGHWKNQLGYRGYIEVWKHAVTGDQLTIDVDEDSSPVDENGNDNPLGEPIWEIYVDSGDNTRTEYLDIYGIFSKVDAAAKKWMAAHPDGLGKDER